MIGKSLGLFFPMLGSLWEMKRSFFLSTNAGNPMAFLPRIWENDGTIFSQVGKYFNMLFPILGNARDKKSPPWERVG